MEWVETTGKTVEEAKEVALDRLGVDEQDAEFEVIEEPRSGLFGRTRGVGRVRARVVPRAPRPKPERRRRTKGDKPSRSQGGESGGESAGSGTSQRSRQRSKGGRGGSDAARTDVADSDKVDDTAKDKSKKDDGAADSGSTRNSGRQPARQKEREAMDEAAQCEAVTTFLEGLGQAFGLEVTASATIEDDVLRASIDGSEVGLFIGPGLGTLEAIQEITRNVLQRHADGREYAKVVLDVSGARELRRTKLTAFVTDAAQQVIDDDVEITFEVMSSPDRKIVHDTVAEIDGVESSSVGEDPRRRVVLKPA